MINIISSLSFVFLTGFTPLYLVNGSQSFTHTEDTFVGENQGNLNRIYDYNYGFSSDTSNATTMYVLQSESNANKYLARFIITSYFPESSATGYDSYLHVSYYINPLSSLDSFFSNYDTLNNIHFNVTIANEYSVWSYVWNGGLVNPTSFYTLKRVQAVTHDLHPMRTTVNFSAYIDNSSVDAIYQDGRSDGLSETGVFSFSNYLYSIADTPVIFLRALFDYDLFGSNLFVILLSLITLVIVLGLIRRFI